MRGDSAHSVIDDAYTHTYIYVYVYMQTRNILLLYIETAVLYTHHRRVGAWIHVVFQVYMCTESAPVVFSCGRTVIIVVIVLCVYMCRNGCPKQQQLGDNAPGGRVS